MEIKLDLYTIINLLGIIQGFFIAGILIGVKKGNKKANWFLAGLMSFFSLSICFGFIYSSRLFEVFPHLIRVPMPFRFLFGPFLYFYVKALTDETFALRGKNLLHLLPFTLYAIYMIPFFLQSGEAKIKWLEYSPAVNMNFGNFLVEILIVIHILCYALVTIKILKKFRQKISTIYSSIKKINLSWIKTFVNTFFLFFVIYIGLMFCFSIIGISNVWIIKSIPIAVSIIIYTFGYRGLIQPQIFADFNLLNSGNKYIKSSLSKDKSKTYFNNLHKLMKVKKLYLDTELTLMTLAEKMQISPQHLSQTINENGKMNFYDYINQYRVKEVVRQLADRTKDHLNILTIAFDAGFNSKSTFNAIFNKFYGFTPRQYRKQHPGN